ncbi:MAG: uroporphyrinogen-III synthase [Gammaproteobacteria bacterium]|nr:uroporphyrinogen-III synthase [Gammaproteobacteria bacterium]MCY4217861.1 uroporphyrinogen-III synthase [Gammaproteobacteria bacterium]MCY4274890.1 uroporphyrinogen-III synthase [Gammaproteobacteria bacterium]
MMTNSGKLSGLRVLVPRPSPQGDQLVTEIRNLGADAFHFPVVETVPPESYEELDQVLHNIDHFHMVIMVSVAAARSVFTRIQVLKLDWPSSVLVCSVGPVTSQVLQDYGIQVDFEPEKEYTSEGLLESLSKVELSGLNVAIFRGQEGRKKLNEELEEAGATVLPVMSYRRQITHQSFDPVIKVWKARGFDVIIITSHNILDALLKLLGTEHEYLIETTPTLAISKRIAEYCKRKKIHHVSICTPGNTSIIKSLIKLSSA